MSDETTAVADQKLVVNRVQMIRIFQLVGLLTADTWTNKQLVDRAVQLTEPDLARMVDEGDREMLDRIISVHEHNETFEVVGDKFQKPISTKEGESTMSENGTATVEKVKKEKKEKVPRVKKEVLPKESRIDQFGCRLGADSAKINAGFSSEPKQLKEIAEEVGLTEKRVTDHVKYWTKKGEKIGKFLEEVEGKGWKLNMGK